jgi:hypothetical protein
MFKYGRYVLVRYSGKKIVSEIFAQNQARLRLLAQRKASENSKPFFWPLPYFIDSGLKIIQFHFYFLLFLFLLNASIYEKISINKKSGFPDHLLISERLCDPASLSKKLLQKNYGQGLSST